MSVAVSVCMCSYQRADLLRATLETIRAQRFPDLEIVVCEDGDDGGATHDVCEEFGARYLARRDRPPQPYSNPSIPWNIAIRHARGDVLILQNPECRHVGTDVIEKLVEPHHHSTRNAVFASALALQPNGEPWQWYCHPRYSARPYFFCGSIRRESVLRVGGFDEDFGRDVGGYGFDDDWFAFCLQMSGVLFTLREDVRVEHQWHPGTECYGLRSNQALYEQKIRSFMEGRSTFECNVGRTWGTLKVEESLKTNGDRECRIQQPDRA